ncbi:galactosylceramidase [Streptomyces canarius]
MSAFSRLFRRLRVLTAVLAGLLLTAGGIVATTAAPAQAATSITINGTLRRPDLRRRRCHQRRGRQQQTPDRLSRAPARPDPGLPVQARLRRLPAHPQGGDRRGHQLHLRGRTESPAHPVRPQLRPGGQWWLMEQAKARNPGIKLYGLAWGAPWPDRRRQLLVHRHGRLPALVAGLRQAARAEHRLPRRVERAGLQHLLVRTTARRARQQRLRQRQDRRGRLRLGRGERHQLQPGVRLRRAPSARTTPAATGRPSPTARYRRPPRRPARRCGRARTARTTTTGERRPWPAASTADTSTAGSPAYFNWPVVASITPNLPYPTMGSSPWPRSPGPATTRSARTPG